MSRRGVAYPVSFKSLLKSMAMRPETISRNNALLWGVAWLIIGAIGAWHFKFVPTSMCGYTTSLYMPLAWHVAMVLAMWMSFGVVYYAFGMLLNRKANMVDIFGCMLFANFPTTLLILPGIMGNRVAYATFMGDVAAAYENYPTDAVIMTVVYLVIVVWSLYWGYLAFRTATQRRGYKTLLTYIVATPLAYYLSVVVLAELYKGIMA